MGASIGLDRMLAGLEELGLMQSSANVADALLIPLQSLEYGYFAAQNLRNLGLKIEVYPEIVKPKKSFAYANTKGYKYVIVLGEEEEAQKTYTLKKYGKRGAKKSFKFGIPCEVFAGCGSLSVSLWDSALAELGISLCHCEKI